jgi:hypothetical protein
MALGPFCIDDDLVHGVFLDPNDVQHVFEIRKITDERPGWGGGGPRCLCHLWNIPFVYA